MSKCIESRAISWLSRERTKATRNFDNALKRSAPADDLINLINKNEILDYLLKLSVNAFMSSDIDAEISFDIPKINETDEMNKDARAYIQQLERERDAAVRDMYEAQGLLCLICKNHFPDPELKKYVCKEFGERYPEDGIIICDKFEWRGVKEDDHAKE